MWLVLLAEALAAAYPGLDDRLPRDARLMHAVYGVVLVGGALLARSPRPDLRVHRWKFHVLGAVVFFFEALPRMRADAGDPLALAYAAGTLVALALAVSDWRAVRRAG